MAEGYPTYASHTVAVYSSHESAEAAIRKLSDEGFDMKKLSIIGQDYHSEERPFGFFNSGDRMWSWGKHGAFWGSIWGLLFGSAFLFIPGAGYLILAGYLVSAFQGAVVGAGFGVLGGALSGIGVPGGLIIQYESDIEAGSFLLIVHGDQEETARAKSLLNESGTTRLDSFLADSASSSAP